MFLTKFINSSRDPREEKVVEAVAETPDAGLTAQYHPVIGDPVSDPPPQPEAAPEVQAELPAQEPQFIDVTDDYGRPYTKVALDKVPDVIRNKDSYIRQLHEQLAQAQRAPQQQVQQPTAPSIVDMRAAQIRQEMIQAGFEDNPSFAKFQAAREIAVQKEAEQVVQSRFQTQQAIAEYETLKVQNPELSLDNPVSRYVYETHAPRNAVEHLALVKFYQGQQQAPTPAPAPVSAPQPVPASVQQMFNPQAARAAQFARPPATAAAPQRVASDPPHVAEAIRQTLSYLNVPADSPRGQAAIAEIRASARTNGGVQ